MSEESIYKALSNLFNDNKVVFWYDDISKLIEQFEDLAIDGIQKIIVENNEFEVKHKIMTSTDETDSFCISLMESHC